MARFIKDVEAEESRYKAAAAAASLELAALAEKTKTALDEELAHILRSQQTMAEDETTREDVLRIIREKSICAEQALVDVFESYRLLFSELSDDDYNKARLADIDDVHKRILRNLLGRPEYDLSSLEAGTVVVAEELFPSDTALFDPAKVVGMITERGGVTSHVAILAKNLGIPAAVGLDGATRLISSGDDVALDASSGDLALIYINPDSEERELLKKREMEYATLMTRMRGSQGLPPVTLDGHRMILSANVGCDQETAAALEHGASSVGLFRSEFLFIGKKKLPDEEAQFRAYKAAVEAFKDGFVIIRTFDVGGDKSVPSFRLLREENPFLGYRALRICLDRPDIFEPQLRAILRASHYGKAKIMFPMVSGLSEVKAAYKVLDSCREQLRAQGIPFDEKMEVGIMIEIPSAVLMARELAGIVDFFSIGTNDLTQYLLAADRMNGKVQAYYRALDPSVFRAIRTVVDAAHGRGKRVAVCGELGGNPIAIPVLLGLGVDELSMSPQSISEAVYTIRNIRHSDARALADKVLSLDSQEAIATLLNSSVKNEE